MAKRTCRFQVGESKISEQKIQKISLKKVKKGVDTSAYL